MLSPRPAEYRLPLSRANPRPLEVLRVRAGVGRPPVILHRDSYSALAAFIDEHPHGRNHLGELGLLVAALGEAGRNHHHARHSVAHGLVEAPPAVGRAVVRAEHLREEVEVYRLELRSRDFGKVRGVRVYVDAPYPGLVEHVRRLRERHAALLGSPPDGMDEDGHLGPVGVRGDCACICAACSAAPGKG